MRNGTVQYYSMADQAWRERSLETVANHSTTSETTLWLLKYLVDAVSMVSQRWRNISTKDALSNMEYGWIGHLSDYFPSILARV